MTPLLVQRAAAGPVPWVIAIMTALGILAAAGAMALGEIAERAGAELAGGATIQIAGPPPAEAARQARAAMAALGSAPEVTRARRMEKQERAALLQSWLGEAALAGSDGLPLPELIELRLRGEADAAALTSLGQRIESAAPDATISADREWLKPVGDAIVALRWLAAALVLLLAAATVAAILTASRSALAANRETIAILHLLGADDRQIATLFQRSAAIAAGLGAAAGLVVASIVLPVLAGRFAALGGGGADSSGAVDADWTRWLVLLLVPLGTVALATLTARLAVLASLRRMP